MKMRIAKVKAELERDEMSMARDVDITKAYTRVNYTQSSSSQKNINK
jgi:hypothetical protein